MPYEPNDEEEWDYQDVPDTSFSQPDPQAATAVQTAIQNLLPNAIAAAIAAAIPQVIQQLHQQDQAIPDPIMLDQDSTTQAPTQNPNTQRRRQQR